MVMGPGTKFGFIPSQKAVSSCCEACAANLQPRQRHLVDVPGMGDTAMPGSTNSYPKKAENFKLMKTTCVRRRAVLRGFLL